LGGIFTGKWTVRESSFVKSWVFFRIVQLLQRELGDRVRFIPFVAWPYKTSDGYICVIVYNDKQWQNFFDATGRDDLRTNPKFSTFAGRAVAAQTRIDPGYGNSPGIDNPDPTPGFATARALEIASCPEFRPVRKT